MCNCQNLDHKNIFKALFPKKVEGYQGWALCFNILLDAHKKDSLQSLPNTKPLDVKNYRLGKNISAIIQRALPPPHVSMVSKELETILACRSNVFICEWVKES